MKNFIHNYIVICATLEFGHLHPFADVTTLNPKRNVMIFIYCKWPNFSAFSASLLNQFLFKVRIWWFSWLQRVAVPQIWKTSQHFGYKRSDVGHFKRCGSLKNSSILLLGQDWLNLPSMISVGLHLQLRTHHAN